MASKKALEGTEQTKRAFLAYFRVLVTFEYE